ncbi:MAG TPA: tyrosine-type recombinase/integrase [Noviherbaspirillum sp.]|nr:tyrosine-type recombinase/integrase [Noviherbaspirillum sp.]
MSYPLFASDDAMSLEQRLNDSFEAWVHSRSMSRSRVRSEKALSAHSAEVYREMWHAFVAFCVTRALDLHQVSGDELNLFLRTRGTAGVPERPRLATKLPDLTPRYGRRFLTLIHWVSTFQAREEGRVPNLAAATLLDKPEYRYANAADKDPPPEYLNEADVKRLIAYVTQLPHRHAMTESLSWKEIRDRTAVALMLGAGLTPGDVRNLRLEGVTLRGGRRSELPWKLALPGNGNSPARETPLAAWAGHQLAYWLQVRTEQAIAGDYVFPSTRAGKQWSDTRCFELTRDVLAAAGMPKETGGLFKLRHTFALRQLAKGKSEADVACWLGLLDINGMGKYRRIVPAPIEVV